MAFQRQYPLNHRIWNYSWHLVEDLRLKKEAKMALNRVNSYYEPYKLHLSFPWNIPLPKQIEDELIKLLDEALLNGVITGYKFMDQLYKTPTDRNSNIP